MNTWLPMCAQGLFLIGSPPKIHTGLGSKLATQRIILKVPLTWGADSACCFAKTSSVKAVSSWCRICVSGLQEWNFVNKVLRVTKQSLFYIKFISQFWVSSSARIKEQKELRGTCPIKVPGYGLYRLQSHNELGHVRHVPPLLGFVRDWVERSVV